MTRGATSELVTVADLVPTALVAMSSPLHSAVQDALRRFPRCPDSGCRAFCARRIRYLGAHRGQSALLQGGQRAESGTTT
jgi:hypothetical protein